VSAAASADRRPPARHELPAGHQPPGEPSDSEQPTRAVVLTAEERDVALAEVEAVGDAAQPGPYADLLAELADAVAAGSVADEEQARALERIVALGLQTGRIRALHGPGGEQAALRAYRKLPGGRELSASAEEVTSALAALRGRPLEQVSLAAVGPGAFTLSLAAGGAEISIRLDRQGARLASVGV